MANDSTSSNSSRQPDWAWKVGLVLETPELVSEVASALAEASALTVFEFQTSVSPFEVANAVHREKPDFIFVELARTSKPAAEWIVDVRQSEESPLIVAVHPMPEPSEMISALRAGASEFLSLPVRPSIFEAMERIGALLESRRNATSEQGKIAGVLSAKGGCGATTIACHLGVALQKALAPSRILIADLDYQSPGARDVCRINPEGADPNANAGEAFDAVRRLNTNAWRRFVTPFVNGVDLLASPAEMSAGATPIPPEPWRVESLFRFVNRQYSWILADLGRHLNPSNWALLQNIDELFIVTAPDVLALYQTRSVLQTLSNRGFDKGRVKLILNRNLNSRHDFWIESIQKMFEMSVFGVIPNDETAFEKLPRDRFEFPAETPFGRSLTKIAARLVMSHSAGGHPKKPA